ncbi:serine/arginine repetitive matrix protein 1-like [Procambarus clarkii]|uniref:serine/arginine repetitive matrix protein 1-like n=1 Tax=Procambarus clarkii TaxID=6728 RepID=UPI0037423A70
MIWSSQIRRRAAASSASGGGRRRQVWKKSSGARRRQESPDQAETATPKAHRRKSHNEAGERKPHPSRKQTTPKKRSRAAETAASPYIQEKGTVDEMVRPPPRPQETLKRRPETEEASRPPPMKRGTRKGLQNPQSEQPFSTPPPGNLAHHEPQQGEPAPHKEPEPSDAGDTTEAGSAYTTPEGEAETQAPASAGKCTSATTVVCIATRATPPSPKDPQSSKSPTSAHAKEERRKHLGSGRTSSDPEAAQEEAPDPPQHPAQPEQMASVQGQGQTQQRENWKTGDLSRMQSEEPQGHQPEQDDQQGTTQPPGGEAATTGGATVITGGTSVAEETSTSTEASTGSGGKSSSLKRFTGTMKQSIAYKGDT